MAAVAHAALEAARKHGAAQAAAQVSRGRFVDIGFRDGDLEKATASAKQGLSIRLFIEGRYGSHATSDLREQTIEGFVAKAAQLTRLLEPDLLRSLPDPARYAKGQAPDLGLWDEALEQSEVEEWMGRARRVEDLTRAEGAKAGTLVSAQGGAYVETSRELLATSDGFLGEQAESGAYAVAGVTLMDPGQEAKRRGGYWWRAGHSLAELGGQAELAQVAATAAARAVRQLGAHPGPSGRVQVLVENQAAGRLLGDLLGALSGAALRQERSYLRRSQGQSVAAPLLTVRDEPLIPGGYGSRWYDPEGVAASPLSIIEGGRLVNFYLDTYYARALEMPPTTGGQSNTVLTPSAPGGFAEIMAGLERGLAVTSFLGGNFNATTGDFSYGLQGLWIEGGKVAHAVEGMNMAGNFKDLWPALARVGDDAFPYARLRSPSLLFAGVQLSGASLAPGQAAG
jgi:PmbA protein